MTLAVTGCARATAESPVSLDASEIENIHVDYQYSGWGHFEERFTLARSADGRDFVLRGQYVDGEKNRRDIEQRVPWAEVQALLSEASAPAWSRETGVRAVAATVSHAGIDRIEPSIRIPPSPCTKPQLQQLARLHVERKGIALLVDEHYGRGIGWTDDYPSVLLQMEFRDRPALRMHSNSQKAMMLPWYPGIPAASPPDSGQNWSLALSRALQAVLPSHSRAYERLGGGRLPGYLKSNIEHQTYKECDAGRATELMKPAQPTKLAGTG